MRTKSLLCGLLLMYTICGCSHQQQLREARQRKETAVAIPEKIVGEVKELAEIQRYLADALETRRRTAWSRFPWWTRTSRWFSIPFQDLSA